MQIQKVIHVYIQSQQKKEWNLVVLTIVSSLDYEEMILSYMHRNGPSLKYRLYVFSSVDNFIKFSTQSINPKLKNRLIKKYDIKDLE